jgi:hypothetical protein
MLNVHTPACLAFDPLITGQGIKYAGPFCANPRLRKFTVCDMIEVGMCIVGTVIDTILFTRNHSGAP